MTIVIGARLLSSDAAKPRPDGPFDLRDSRLKGFILRVNPSGVRVYYAQTGRGKRVKLGSVDVLLPDEARERCLIVLGNVAKGQPPLLGIAGQSDGDKTTLQRFIDDTWKPWAEVERARTVYGTYMTVKKHFAKWLPLPLTAITPQMIDAWITARLDAGAAKSSARRDADALAGILSRAVFLKLIPVSPMREVVRPKLNRKPRVRYLSMDEERRLRAALAARDAEKIAARDNANRLRIYNGREPLPKLPHFGDHLTPAVLISLLTGLRRSELLRLKWSDVDYETKLLHIGIAKNDNSRAQPLVPEAIQVLKQWHAQRLDDERIFPFSEDFKNSWTALKKRANVQRFTWRALRHSYASSLMQLGANLNTVRKLLDHQDMRTTLIYADIGDTDMRATANLLSQRAKQVKRLK